MRTCCLCGADESQGPLDPRRCYGHPPGSVRCVSINECALRAELRDVRAELARMTEYRDNARARLDRAAHDLLREACALSEEPADPISGRELLAALDRVSDETLDAIEEGTGS